MKRIMYWTIKSTKHNIEMKVCNLAQFTRVANLIYSEVYAKISKSRKENGVSVEIGDWMIGWEYSDPIQALFNYKNIQVKAFTTRKPHSPMKKREKTWTDKFINRRCIA